MKVNKRFGNVRIDGFINIEAPDGWGQKVFREDPEWGEIKYDYDALEDLIEEKLGEVGIEADIQMIDNAGSEEENIQFVVEQ